MLPLAEVPCRACPALLLSTRCWHLGVCSCSCISKPSERSRNGSRIQLIDRKPEFWLAGGIVWPKGTWWLLSVQCPHEVLQGHLPPGHWLHHLSTWPLATQQSQGWLAGPQGVVLAQPATAEMHVLLSNLPELSAGRHLLICCLLLLS